MKANAVARLRFPPDDVRSTRRGPGIRWRRAKIAAGTQSPQQHERASGTTTHAPQIGRETESALQAWSRLETKVTPGVVCQAAVAGRSSSVFGRPQFSGPNSGLCFQPATADHELPS